MNAVDPKAGLGPVAGVADRVLVLGMPDSHARRRNAEAELARLGVARFAFFDAGGPDHPDAVALQSNGGVQRFPPCFRCGGLDCGKPDCNNFLIPQQVACFASFLRLFRAIAEGGRTTLVMEDDIRFRPTAADGFRFLADAVAQGRLDLSPGHAALVRLGWPLGAEHDAPGPFTLGTGERMANHCFLITPAAARRALEMFDKVRTTSDIFLHVHVAAQIDARTLFPPIASDISWSDGQFESLIHPKPRHAAHLERSGNAAAADDYRAKIARHIKRKFARRILVVGHPRTGTAYTAAALGQLGLEIGHEADGRDGLASWMFVTDADPVPWHKDKASRTRRALHWDRTILTLRDPASAIPSIIREDRHAPDSYAFRRDAIRAARGVDLDACETEIDKAIWSLTSWTRMALDLNPDHVFRIGRDEAALTEALAAAGIIDPAAARPIDPAPVNADKPYKGRHHPKPTLTDADWRALSFGAARELAWYCARFDYPMPAPARSPCDGPS